VEAPAWETTSLGGLAVASLHAAAFAGDGTARPPLGIYNISITQVEDRLARLLDTLEARPSGARSTGEVDGHEFSVWEPNPSHAARQGLTVRVPCIPSAA
jgi:hypothetical protein